VDDAQYVLCGAAAASPVLGPWENTFWDPIAIRPVLGTLDVVFVVNAKASKLTFTDGTAVIDLDALLKP